MSCQRQIQVIAHRNYHILPFECVEEANILIWFAVVLINRKNWHFWGLHVAWICFSLWCKPTVQLSRETEEAYFKHWFIRGQMTRRQSTETSCIIWGEGKKKKSSICLLFLLHHLIVVCVSFYSDDQWIDTNDSIIVIQCNRYIRLLCIKAALTWLLNNQMSGPSTSPIKVSSLWSWS